MEPYDLETNNYCMIVGFSSMRDDRQSSNTILNPEKKMTIPSHIRDLKKNYGQMKKYVQLKDIQKTNQKEYYNEFVEIKEIFSKLEKLIQESNKDEYYGCVMKNKKVQWRALQQKQRQQSLAWRKDKYLKIDELKKRLIMKRIIHSCEHESENFLRKTIGADTGLIESLLEYSRSESQQEEFVMELPNEALESYGFNIDYLCVDAGYIESYLMLS